MITITNFLQLPTNEVSNLVKENQCKVIVFPFNGTRRWFLLEHGEKIKNPKDFVQFYIEETMNAYIRVYKMLFAHGIETVIAPVFGSEILERGEEYMQQIGASMALLAQHPAFLDFYNEYDVRVHFYGDYRQELAKTKYANIIDHFNHASNQTQKHKTCRLFYGVFAHDATQRIAEIAVQQYQFAGVVPTRSQIIEAYYGEYIERANLFIGFEKFTVFDYPMLSDGEESLYFTVAPSLYMTEKQLREILYDHIYLRPLSEPDYLKMSKAELAEMKEFYSVHQASTFGVGKIKNGIWYSTLSS